MSDRPAELRRQRALIAEHLAWLDREIARATPAASPAPDSPAPTTPPLPSAPAPLPPPPELKNLEADAILDRYRTEERSLKDDVRKGCFLYCAAAVVLLALGVAAIYIAYD
jgi:hypothetical protein